MSVLIGDGLGRRTGSGCGSRLLHGAHSFVRGKGTPHLLCRQQAQGLSVNPLQLCTTELNVLVIILQHFTQCITITASMVCRWNLQQEQQRTLMQH